jgi:hypothetical protein
VQEKTSEEREPSDEDTTKVTEAERLSSEALTDTVREILATSSAVEVPSIEIKSENIQSTEQSSKSTISPTASES